MMAKLRPRKKPSPAKAKRVRAAHISSSSPKSISSTPAPAGRKGRKERNDEGNAPYSWKGRKQRREGLRRVDRRAMADRRAGKKALLLLLLLGDGKSFAAIGIWRKFRDEDKERRHAQKYCSNFGHAPNLVTVLSPQIRV
jgi:hypothetical protein